MKKNASFFWFFLGKERAVILGRVGNWCSGLGLAYPYFHEDVSVSSLFVWQCLPSLKQKKQKCLCNLRNLWLLLRFKCSGLVHPCRLRRERSVERLNHTVWIDCELELAWAIKCQTLRFNRGRLNQLNYRVLVLYQSPLKISYQRIFNLTLFMNGRKDIINYSRGIIFPEGSGWLSWAALFDHK